MYSYLCALAALLAFPRFSAAATTISTFADASCNASLRSLSGPNGYPNGTCTDLRRNGPYGSFHIISLDPGCTVTIYQKDTTENVCSGQAEFGAPLECYKSDYVYYSIDFCDPGAVQTSVPTPSSTPSSKTHTPAIVGGVLGGVIGLAIIAGIAFWMWRKKRAEKQQRQQGENGLDGEMPVSELHAHNRSEMGTGKVAYRQDAAEVEAPPVEIGGTEVHQQHNSLPGK